MKLRLIAIFVILFVAAWLPIIAQQSPPPPDPPQTQTPPAADTSKSADKPACPCCNHDREAQAKSDSSPACCHGKNSKAAHSMPCCEGNDAKDMPCCNKDAKNKRAAATCCKGKEGAMCAKHNGKDCCDQRACKSCCAKNTTAIPASDADTENCCAGGNHCCHPSKG